MIKNTPASARDTGDVGSIFGSERPKEKKMETHSSILVWEIPWTEEPGTLITEHAHAHNCFTVLC